MAPDHRTARPDRAVDLGRELEAELRALREREDHLLDTVGVLLRNNDELAVFAGRVAHDMRAPLTALAGYLALADGPFRDETSPRAAACVASALGSARRMQRLVEDLLAYATFTARPVLGPVALPAVVREVRLDLLTELSRAGADVAYSGPDEVVGDPTLLRQLLQNLVGNAVTHARPGVPPRVVVRAGVTGASWWLEVGDNGPGIPADQRERVLDPLVRLTGPDGPAGSGIGLATCARIAEALGGTIAVDAAPGGGAAVRVTLPVPRPAGAAGPGPTGPWYG